MPINNCNYEISSISPKSQEIYGEYSGSGYGFIIYSSPHSDPTNEFIPGLLEIRVEYYGEDPDYNGETFYFYWDVADCNYYQTGCGSFQSGDIIIKFELPSLKFYWGNDPESVSDPVWEEVTGQTRRFIDYALNGTEPCQLTSIPTGLSVAGPVGGNPTISWNPNTEVGLGGYKLYRSIDGDPYLLLAILDAETTSYVDHGVIVGNSRFDPAVCYTLSAFGNIDVESPKTF